MVLVHDPELLLAAAGLGMTNLIWDVHEDPAAALRVKSWMPKMLRRPVAAAWRGVEKVAERRASLIAGRACLSEEVPRVASSGCQFRIGPEGRCPAGADRVSYLGSVTMSVVATP